MYFCISISLFITEKDASKRSQAQFKLSKWLLGVIFGKISFYKIAAIKIPVRIAMNFLMLKT